MAPRKYSMARRAEAEQEIRRRILEATMALHAERGIFGTSRKEIAQRADVSVATVYNHFPALDDLVMACGELVEAKIQPPTLDQASRIFAGSASADERLGRLVAELFAFYERGAPYIETDRLERRLPAIQEWEAFMRATVEGLVREALQPLSPDEQVIQVVSALLDFSAFKPFLERGIATDRAVRDMTEMLVCWLANA